MFPQEMYPSVFSKSFLSSPAFKYGRGDKTIGLKAILKFYGTPGQCAMMFDDQIHNKKYADKTGVYFRQVNEDKGVAWSDYSAALKEMRKRCRCK